MTEASLLLSVYGSVIGERGVAYCSAPVTSGRRLLEWNTGQLTPVAGVDHVHEAARDQFHQQVIVPNQRAASALAHSLRARLQLPVLDPSVVLPVAGWKQEDWMQFWNLVIARFVRELHFVDDWQYSRGCTIEFLAAHRQALPTFDAKGARLTRAHGIDLICSAAEVLRANQQSTVFLDEIVDGLRTLGESP